MIKTLHARYQGNLPRYMSDEAAGADLISDAAVKIDPGQIGVVKTGTNIAFPKGTCGMLMPRSSICKKNGLILMNSVGLVDSDYTGDIMMMYMNIGTESVILDKGERVGQIACIPYIHLLYDEAPLEATERGEGGFGSTGKH